MKLDQKGKVLAEYIWIDGSNGMRNKTKVSQFCYSQTRLQAQQNAGCCITICCKSDWQRNAAPSMNGEP